MRGKSYICCRLARADWEFHRTEASARRKQRNRFHGFRLRRIALSTDEFAEEAEEAVVGLLESFAQLYHQKRREFLQSWSRSAMNKRQRTGENAEGT